ncbi:MAG: hypothetical protein ACRD4R_13605 [Candidatus Acidiferrales bacterium]
MPRQSNVYEVLIASPSDVHAERTVLTEVIEDWNSANSRARSVSLQAVRWELDSFPESGGRPQELINKQIVESADVLIAVFWSRLGTPTGDAASGTVEEIEHFREKGKPVLLYFSEADVPRNHDQDQLRDLRDYQMRVEVHTRYGTFRGAEALRRTAARDLARLMNELAPGSEFGFEAQLKAQKVPGVKLVFQTQGQPVMPGTSVKPVRVFATIENASTTRRVREYAATLSVPRCCLGFQNSVYPAEVESRDPNYRKLRHTERDWGNRPIFPGDHLQVISVDVAVGHLSAGQRETCLGEELIGDLVADGEAYQARATLSELLVGKI